MPPNLTFAVGDIHGCAAKARDLLSACMEYNGDRSFCFIFLGDYVDRGEDSLGVVELLMELEQAAPGAVLCLRGNHEEMLIGAIRDAEVEDIWLANGGDATLASYGVPRARDIPERHRAWIGERPLLYRDERRLYVHAGIMPGVPLQRQRAETLLWIREEFLSSRADHGLFVVHGHTPHLSGPELLPNRLNLDTGACYGGVLTAAVFDDTAAVPVAFITDNGNVVGLDDYATLREAYPRA